MKKVITIIILLLSILCNAQLKNISLPGKGKIILLDYYFNNEYKNTSVKYHYTWEDSADSGFSLFGNIFKQYGAKLKHLSTAPSFSKLKNASIYIIVDPDTKEETGNPNYITKKDAQVIYNWVKAGGVLLLMMNDSGHTEFEHVNILANKFGIRFNENSINHVQNKQYENGALYISKNDSIFKHTKKIFLKELSTLSLIKPASPHLKNKNGEVIMAVSKILKGTVFAVGDPWFYNEYINNKNLPVEFENTKAAYDLAKWLLQQVDVK